MCCSAQRAAPYKEGKMTDETRTTAVMDGGAEASPGPAAPRVRRRFGRPLGGIGEVVSLPSSVTGAASAADTPGTPAPPPLSAPEPAPVDGGATAAMPRSAESLEQGEEAAAHGNGVPEAEIPASAASEEDVAAAVKTPESPHAPLPEPGPAQALFVAFARCGPLSLLLIACLFFWPSFWTGGFYLPLEGVFGQTFWHALHTGQWLTPTMDGAALPPLMHWLLLGLYHLLRLTGLPEIWVFPLYGLIGAAVALSGVWAAARAAGAGRDTAFAAGLLLLITPGFVVLGNHLDPQALATGLMMLALAGFCRGWSRERAPFSLPLGFIMAALAGLTGGVCYFLTPIVASFAFLLRHMAFRRAQRWDAIMGFALMLGLLAVWGGALIFMASDTGYGDAFVGFLTGSDPLPDWMDSYEVFLIMTAVLLLPWLALPLFVSWTRVIREIWNNRNNAEHRPFFLWLAFFAASGAYFTRPDAGLALLLPAILSPLLARALLRLSFAGSRFFYLLTALLLLHMGIFSLLYSFEFTMDLIPQNSLLHVDGSLRQDLLSLRFLPMAGAVCLFSAILLTRFTRRAFPAGALLVLTLGVLLINQPVRLQLVHEIQQRVPAISTIDNIAVPAPAEVPASSPEAAAVPAPSAPAEEAGPAPEAAVPVPAEVPASSPEAPAVPAPSAPEEEAAPAPEAAAPAEETPPDPETAASVSAL